MNGELIRAILTSPVLVAAVPAVLAVFGGRYLLEAKDQRIASLQEAHAEALRAKDAQIELLQWLSPVRLREQVEAMGALMEMRTEQLEARLAEVTGQLHDRRQLSDDERTALVAELDGLRVELDRARTALESSDKAKTEVATMLDDIGQALESGSVAPTADEFREEVRALVNSPLMATATTGAARAAYTAYRIWRQRRANQAQQKEG